MTKSTMLTLVFVSLAACKTKTPQLPEPVEMTEEAVGFYCQMDLLKHEGPKGQIHLEGALAPIFFSQVRDTIAYLHMPEQSHAVVATYVQDMADAESWGEPGDWIAIEDAIYVVGSDQMGGMDAPEFVPFSSKPAAVAFIARHGGALRRFDEIKAEDALKAPSTQTDSSQGSDIAKRLRALAPTDRTN